MAVKSGLMFLGEPVLTWRGGQRAERVIVFLHGSGDTGPGLADWLDSLNVRASLDDKTVLMFPSALARPYSMYGGESSTVWHDRKELSISAWEDREGIAHMATTLDTFITQICHSEQLNRQNVVLGGFSQGGHMSLQAVFGHRVEVSACFALSSFLCEESSVYEALRSGEAEAGRKTPLFMSTGTEDCLVAPHWVHTTRERLAQLGVTVTHSLIQGLAHQMEARQLEALLRWINNNSC